MDYDIVAVQSFSSTYYFQRIFSILCGFTVGEYIRNRRLSLAGSELDTTDIKVIDVAVKYGYESPDSFAKSVSKISRYNTFICADERQQIEILLPSCS